MAIKYFISLLFLLSANLLHAQKLATNNLSNKNSKWEKIINRADHIKGDTSKIKIYLKPLSGHYSESGEILYNVLLANSYAKNYDRINSKSDYYYTKALRDAADAHMKPLEIWATLSYAEYLYNYRQITKSLPVFLAAIDKIEKINADQLLFPGRSFTKIGFYLDTIGDDTEAIAYLKNAKRFTNPTSSEYATILDNLGMSYLKKGDLANAEKNIRKSSTLARSIGDQLRYAKTLGNLAQIYERNKDYKTAIQLTLEDIRITEAADDDKNLMYANTLLTRLYLANNQVKEAKITVEKAGKIAKSKPYFKINELDILKLQLNILQNESREYEELQIRRRVEVLEDSLNRTDGILPLNQANWLMQKRKYQKSIASTNERAATQSFWKNIIFSTVGLLLSMVLFVFFSAKNKEKRKRIMIEEKMVKYQNSKIQIERKLSDAHRTLDAQIDFLKDKNLQIQKLHNEIENIKQSKSSFKNNVHVKLDDLLQSHLMTDENWRNFRNEFQRENFEFYANLMEHFPEITDSNLRIILLQKLGFTNSEIAGLLGITIDAVKKSKQRLKRKLGEKYDLLFQMIVS